MLTQLYHIPSDSNSTHSPSLYAEPLLLMLCHALYALISISQDLVTTASNLATSSRHLSRKLHNCTTQFRKRFKVDGKPTFLSVKRSCLFYLVSSCITSKRHDFIGLYGRLCFTIMDLVYDVLLPRAYCHRFALSIPSFSLGYFHAYCVPILLMYEQLCRSYRACFNLVVDFVLK